MGRSTTPTYRLVIREHQTANTPMAWKYGKPTTANLEKYIKDYAKSLELGGVNQHVSLSLGYVPYPDSAQIIRQSDNEVVAEWKAAMFQVW